MLNPKKLAQLPKQFTIDRATWRFGSEAFDEEFGSTFLLNNKGYRCCLGFISAQCGLHDHMLLSQCDPCKVDYRAENPSTEVHPLNGFLVRTVELEDDMGILPPEETFTNTWLTEEAIGINDDPNLSLQEREKQLRELFKKVGFEILFTGEYTPVQLKLAKKIADNA